MNLTMGSLFDGIGGFPLAAERYGIKTLWASEIEPFPMKVTGRRFPGMAHKGDITKLNGRLLLPVDIICGGSPCQDLSVAGARAGLSGARSGLFMEQIRIIKEMRTAERERGRTGADIRPRWMCWENVPGAFSSGSPKGEDFRIVLEEIIRIHDIGAEVPQSYPYSWPDAGDAVMENGFSLAWRCLEIHREQAGLSHQSPLQPLRPRFTALLCSVQGAETGFWTQVVSLVRISLQDAG